MQNRKFCPLCEKTTGQWYWQDRRRYLCCQCCGLVYVPQEFHLDEGKEKAEYDLHENSMHDAGYKVFLSRAAEPLKQLLNGVGRGLDFGCGPAPLLANMLEEAGFEMAIYDKFYASDNRVLTGAYDFISLTEVAEHLPAPGQTLQQLWALLKPEGYLLIMTKRVIDQASFQGWHYKNDPTHISFFSDQTMNYLAHHWQAEIVVQEKDVVVFKKLEGDGQ
jgi:SAM-dependent methyltransferase